MKTVAVVLGTALIAWAVGACSDNDDAGTSSTETGRSTSGVTDARSEGTGIQLWFTRGAGVVPVELEAGDSATAEEEALLALLDGPERGSGLRTVIPRESRLLGLTITDGHAKVNLSPEFEIRSGSTAEALVLAQLVYTLTEFPTVDTVSLRFKGERVKTFGSHGYDVARMNRTDFSYLTQSGS